VPLSDISTPHVRVVCLLLRLLLYPSGSSSIFEGSSARHHGCARAGAVSNVCSSTAGYACGLRRILWRRLFIQPSAYAQAPRWHCIEKFWPCFSATGINFIMSFTIYISLISIYIYIRLYFWYESLPEIKSWARISVLGKTFPGRSYISA
jgi:hypothetical protein